jgi:hypothetical protein
LLAALLVLAGLVAGLWWWRHPTVYQSAAPTWSVGGGETYPVDSEPISIGMTWFRVPRPGEPATLHAAAPHVLVNTAEATLTFSVCQVADHGTISSVCADLHRWCSKLLPIKDTRLALTYHYPRRQVMMTITPTRPGVVRIQGMDLTYSYRHQSGTQHVGEYAWFRYR